jgi:glycosyltransferase involved in cell wall biosynthesis
MSQDASVNVIVPCYNFGRFLKDCVESVLAQTGVNLRVLILDDASTDNSARVAAELLAADSRIEYRAHATNQGHISTYNEGLNWATGTYIVVLDADDMLTKGSLRRACDLLDAHPKLGFVYGRVRVFYGDRRPGHASTTQPTSKIWRGREWFESLCRITENCVRQPAVVVRTSVLKNVGDFRLELPHTADMEMWMRLALHADVGYIAGPDQAFYRDHSAGMHRERFGTERAHIAQVIAAFEALFRDYGHILPNQDGLEKSVRQTLARRALDAACRAYDSGRPNLAEVAGLEELATTTYDGARGLREWRRLRWRRKVGPLACLALRPFLVFTIASRTYRKLKLWRVHRTGLPIACRYRKPMETCIR